MKKWCYTGLQDLRSMKQRCFLFWITNYVLWNHVSTKQMSGAYKFVSRTRVARKGEEK